MENIIVTAIASPTSIYPGGSSTLTAEGGSTYLWNTGATTTTITVSPIVTTGYTLTGTSVFGTTGSTTILLIVNPPVGV
jgi:hypothetical protein